MATQIARPTKYNPVPQDTKAYILEDCKARILAGHTLDEIAADHSVTSRTLRHWLSALGDEYKDLREQWIDNMLADATEAIESADDQFPLARAVARLKAVQWYVERRDRRYAPTQASLSDALAEARSRVIEAQSWRQLPDTDSGADPAPE
jgi:transposase-like protein